MLSKARGSDEESTLCVSNMWQGTTPRAGPEWEKHTHNNRLQPEHTYFLLVFTFMHSVAQGYHGVEGTSTSIGIWALLGIGMEDRNGVDGFAEQRSNTTPFRYRSVCFACFAPGSL